MACLQLEVLHTYSLTNFRPHCTVLHHTRTIQSVPAGVGSEELHKERAAVHPSAAAQQPTADCPLPGPGA